MLVQHEKQAAFGLLAAGIAHEVGNPLAAISSLVQILKRKSDDLDTIERYQMIGDQLRRIQGTLRELVDFSRPANTQASLCDVRNTVEDALSIAKYYKRRKGKSIVTRYAEGLPTVRVVHDQLVQVFLNLILNAMDATPEGGTIEISTSLESGWLRINVRDTGHGILEANRNSIFEPYYTTKSTGTGLGLFVCRQLLERESNGQIDLTETGSDGTTFSVLVTGENLEGLKDIPSPTAEPTIVCPSSKVCFQHKRVLTNRLADASERISHPCSLATVTEVFYTFVENETIDQSPQSIRRVSDCSFPRCCEAGTSVSETSVRSN